MGGKYTHNRSSNTDCMIASDQLRVILDSPLNNSEKLVRIKRLVDAAANERVEEGYIISKAEFYRRLYARR